MEDRCNSLIPSDIETNRCEEVLRHCRPKECKPVNQYLDDCDVVPTPQDWMKFNSEDEVASEFEETSSFVKNTICDLKEKLELWASRLRNPSDMPVLINCAVEDT
ncbi:hypothetical protein P8452_01793 [Trifolium repens]|nr:hypothetical protein P8452_01793 [Trifolium repens]